MAKRAKPEEIIAKLREIEVRLSQGESVGMGAKSIGVHTVTFMLNPLTSCVSPTATNLIDASALPMLARGVSARAIAHPDRHVRYGRDGVVSGWAERG